MYIDHTRTPTDITHSCGFMRISHFFLFLWPFKYPKWSLIDVFFRLFFALDNRPYHHWKTWIGKKFPHMHVLHAWISLILFHTRRNSFIRFVERSQTIVCLKIMLKSKFSMYDIYEESTEKIYAKFTKSYDNDKNAWNYFILFDDNTDLKTIGVFFLFVFFSHIFSHNYTYIFKSITAYCKNNYRININKIICFYKYIDVFFYIPTHTSKIRKQKNYNTQPCIALNTKTNDVMLLEQSTDIHKKYQSINFPLNVRKKTKTNEADS